MDQNEQSEHSIKREGPKAFDIRRRKQLFLKALRTNGGVVSDALKRSGLKRSAAYAHFRNDPEFAEEWQEARESGLDALLEEARRRAVDGIDVPVRKSGRVVGTTKRHSDSLLIYLIKRGEYQVRWRRRLIQAGELALESVEIAAEKAGLTDEQISIVQKTMIEQFGKVKIGR